MKSSFVKFLPIGIATLVWFFYNGLLFPKYHTFRNNSCEIHYFKDLAISFTKGKMDINYPVLTKGHDLVKYNNKYYLYWPPAPAIAYIPVVLVFGRNSPDDLISSILGSINVFLVMGIVLRFSKLYKIPINQFVTSLIGIFWGLGTVHFYMSMSSAVWFYSQIIAQTFFLGSIFVFLVFVKSRSIISLVFSGILWGMACYSRNDLIFSIFFFSAIFYNSLHKEINISMMLKKGILFLLPFFLFSVANLTYNYARFGNILENGIQFHRMEDAFVRLFNQYGYFSWHYLKYNFCVEVLSTPPFIRKFPFFAYNWEGFGFLWASPVFLILLPLVFIYIYHIETKKLLLLDKKDVLVLAGLLMSTIFIAGLIFCIMGTGWVQFGSRYTLDFHILILLFSLFIFKLLKPSFVLYISLLILLTASIYINFIGVIYYFNLYPL